MPKLVTDYLKRSCFAPLSIEEPSSLSTVETSSSQRTVEMFKCSTKCSNLKNNNINEEKSTNENNESILVQCKPGPDCSFPLKQFGKKKRSYQVSWFKNFSWLHYYEEKHSVFYMFCIKQKGELRAEHNMEEAYVTKGFNN